MESLFDDDDAVTNENVNQNLSVSISNSSFSSVENSRQGTISLHQLLALRSSPLHQKKMLEMDKSPKPLFVRRSHKTENQEENDDDSIQFCRPKKVHSQVFESPLVSNSNEEDDDSPQTQVADNNLVLIGRRKTSKSRNHVDDDSSPSRQLIVDGNSLPRMKQQQMEEFLNSAQTCAKCDETMSNVLQFLERESQRDAEISDLRRRLAVAEKVIEQLGEKERGDVK